MTQNQHNAVIHLGHQNGTVTLWTPNLSHPAVRLLAHLGPVSSVAMDQSTGGRYMATAGVDGVVKLWDCRSWRDALRSWNSRGGHATLAWSQRGCLAVASGGAVNVGTIFGFQLHVIITLPTSARCIPRHQCILPVLRPLHLHYI
jgi:U3 small nucleolar RNA-associated protein 7